VVVTDNLDLAFVTDVDTLAYTPCVVQCLGCCTSCKQVETGVVSVSSVDGIKTVRGRHGGHRKGADWPFFI